MSLGFIPRRSGQLRFSPLRTRALPRCGASLYVAGLCLASPLAAAFDSGSADTLTDVIVTSTKIETPAQYSTQSVTVITEDEIKEKNYTDTTEILRQTTGIQFNQAGGPGQFNYPKLRGFGSGHFLVVVDGVKINEGLSPGVGNFLGQIDPKLIEKIEILRGPKRIFTVPTARRASSPSPPKARSPANIRNSRPNTARWTGKKATVRCAARRGISAIRSISPTPTATASTITKPTGIFRPDQTRLPVG